MENNFLRGQKEVKKHKLRSQIAITNLNRKIANWGFCVDTLICLDQEALTAATRARCHVTIISVLALAYAL